MVAGSRLSQYYIGLRSVFPECSSLIPIPPHPHQLPPGILFWSQNVGTWDGWNSLSCLVCAGPCWHLCASVLRMTNSQHWCLRECLFGLFLCSSHNSHCFISLVRIKHSSPPGLFLLSQLTSTPFSQARERRYGGFSIPPWSHLSPVSLSGGDGLFTLHLVTSRLQLSCLGFALGQLLPPLFSLKS